LGHSVVAPRPTTLLPAKLPSRATDRTVLLNVGFVDQTGDRPPSKQFLIETPNSTHWQPDALEGSHTTRAFEKYPVRESQKLLLYPKGKGGVCLAVPFTMKPDMSSVLASSRTNIAVHDDSIVVTGPAVPEEKIVLDRPAAQAPEGPSN
jgi:hypothetical protein